MKFRTFGFSTYMGLGVIIFVTLVGALGYMYVMSSKAEIASTTRSDLSKTIVAETMTVPEIKDTSDLEQALVSLDEASVDTMSELDLEALQKELESF